VLSVLYRLAQFLLDARGLLADQLGLCPHAVPRGVSNAGRRQRLHPVDGQGSQEVLEFREPPVRQLNLGNRDVRDGILLDLRHHRRSTGKHHLGWVGGQLRRRWNVQ
jgi:hypothetical protein